MLSHDDEEETEVDGMKFCLKTWTNIVNPEVITMHIGILVLGTLACTGWLRL